MTAIHEGARFINISATTAAFRLDLGGYYTVSVHATFGGGNVHLQQLAADDTTWLEVEQAFNNAAAEIDLVTGAFLADGVKAFILAPGQFRFTVTTATGVYIAIARAPVA